MGANSNERQKSKTMYDEGKNGTGNPLFMRRKEKRGGSPVIWGWRKRTANGRFKTKKESGPARFPVTKGKGEQKHQPQPKRRNHFYTLHIGKKKTRRRDATPWQRVNFEKEKRWDVLAHRGGNVKLRNG